MNTSDIAKTLGKRGGDKTKAKHGDEYYKKLAMQGVEGKKKKRLELKTASEIASK